MAVAIVATLRGGLHRLEAGAQNRISLPAMRSSIARAATCCDGHLAQELAMENPICWFELPAVDIGRAARFYKTVFGVISNREDSGGHPMTILPYARSSKDYSTR